MLKKIFTISLLIGAVSLLNAQERNKKNIISKGFFLNIGVAFPSQTFTATNVKTETASSSGGTSTFESSGSSTGDPQTLGVMPSLEIGNQWYFWKNEKMGVGLRASWFQIGYSTYKVNDIDLTASSFDLRFIKLAPQFTYALADEMALDFSFEVAPTFLFSAAAKDDNLYASSSVGLLFAPGVKFRYKVFAAGFDFGFGSPATAAIYTLGNNTTYKTVVTGTGTASTLYPRIYLGFKF